MTHACGLLDISNVITLLYQLFQYHTQILKITHVNNLVPRFLMYIHWIWLKCRKIKLQHIDYQISTERSRQKESNANESETRK